MWASWGQDREASNPGHPRTCARVRMEEETEAVMTGSEAAITRIDDSSDDEPSCQRGGMMSAGVQK